MRFVHTSDLHIGLQFHGYSLHDDQVHMLDEIVAIAKESEADGILVAGDVYNNKDPSEASFGILEHFLKEASEVCPVYMIPGNHDSAPRLSQNSTLLKASDVNIAGRFSKKMEKATVSDEHGDINIWMLPFVQTSPVRNMYDDKDIINLELAIERIIRESGVDPSERNVLIAHQFVTGSGIDWERSDSEKAVPEVGGADSVSASVFSPYFDYVALGHIHRPQNAGHPAIRYSGSPLRYSEDEARDGVVKGVYVVDVGEKGEVSAEFVPIEPLHEVRYIRGTAEELASAAREDPSHKDDYICAVIEGEIRGAQDLLEDYYDHVMCVVTAASVSAEPGSGFKVTEIEDIRKKDPLEVFERFYLEQNGTPLSDYQKKLFREAQSKAEDRT